MHVHVPASLILLVWGETSDENLHNSPLGLSDLSYPSAGIPICWRASHFQCKCFLPALPHSLPFSQKLRFYHQLQFLLLPSWMLIIIKLEAQCRGLGPCSPGFDRKVVWKVIRLSILISILPFIDYYRYQGGITLVSCLFCSPAFILASCHFSALVQKGACFNFMF